MKQFNISGMIARNAADAAKTKTITHGTTPVAPILPTK